METEIASAPVHRTSINAVQRSLGDAFRKAAPALLIICASLTVNLIGNNKVSLWDRDEPRYAQSVREMRQGSHWLTPSFNGEPRYQKPILIYWLMRATTALAGDTPFGARLVSSASGACLCLCTWFLGRRMFGSRVGFISALILATAPIVVVESKLATTDAALALLVTCAMACAWELKTRRSLFVSLLFCLLMALAC